MSTPSSTPPAPKPSTQASPAIDKSWLPPSLIPKRRKHHHRKHATADASTKTAQPLAGADAAAVAVASPPVVAPPKPVIAVDESTIPVQTTDVTPLNPVGFSSGNVEYVRPRPDASRVPGQRYCVLSYVTARGAHIRSRDTMVKFSGAFADEVAAKAQAERIRNADPRIDVHVIEMYNFVTVPMPKEVFDGLEKHYIDEKLDKIMHEKTMEVQRDRKMMELRQKADKEKALQNMRIHTGNANYQPPDHKEFIERQMQQELQQQREASRQDEYAAYKYTGEDIAHAIEQMLKQSKEAGIGQEQSEQMVSGLLEKLVEQRDARKHEEHAERDKAQREAEQGIQAVRPPAVSDFMPNTEPPRPEDGEMI